MFSFFKGPNTSWGENNDFPLPLIKDKPTADRIHPCIRKTTELILLSECQEDNFSFLRESEVATFIHEG